MRWNLVNPRYSFSVLKVPLPSLSLRTHQHSFSMLHSAVPIPLILSPIRPFENPVAFLRIQRIVPSIHSSIRPSECPVPMHFILRPLPIILSSVVPPIHSASLNPIAHEVSLKGRPIRPDKLPFSVLPSEPVLALIIGPVFPSFNPEAMLLIIKPFSLISGP